MNQMKKRYIIRIIILVAIIFLAAALLSAKSKKDGERGGSDALGKIPSKVIFCAKVMIKGDNSVLFLSRESDGSFVRDFRRGYEKIVIKDDLILAPVLEEKDKGVRVLNFRQPSDQVSGNTLGSSNSMLGQFVRAEEYDKVYGIARLLVIHVLKGHATDPLYIDFEF